MRRRVAPRPAQALLEAAIVLPLLLFLVFAVIGVGRLTRAQMSVSGVAREAARAAALANTPGEAGSRGRARGLEVAAANRLAADRLVLVVQPGALAPGSRVDAAATYRVRFDDLPLLGWASVTVRSEQWERVDLYRSRPDGGAP